jgi:outer membrane murein-binding lipoprotein Lpp
MRAFLCTTRRLAPTACAAAVALLLLPVGLLGAERPSLAGLQSQLNELATQVDTLEARVDELETTTTKCDTSAHCADSAYCAKEAGDCEGLGRCTYRPEICPDVWNPVCGCNGTTYSNDCYAAMEGVSVKQAGSCPPPNCTTNADCTSGSFCEKPDGDCPGTGVCRVIEGTVCTADYNPVCGCDAVTYSNRCHANVAGTSVLHTGVCAPAGCASNADCAVDNYCAKPFGECAVMGQCQSRPQYCPLIYNPVCGCDGMTYTNDCVAAAHGVNVLYVGPCGSPP